MIAHHGLTTQKSSDGAPFCGNAEVDSSTGLTYGTLSFVYWGVAQLIAVSILVNLQVHLEALSSSNFLRT